MREKIGYGGLGAGMAMSRDIDTANYANQATAAKEPPVLAALLSRADNSVRGIFEAANRLDIHRGRLLNPRAADGVAERPPSPEPSSLEGKMFELAERLEMAVNRLHTILNELERGV